MSASTPILYGAPQSTYVRTARMALEAKRATYVNESLLFGDPDQQASMRVQSEFVAEPIAMGSEAHRRLHPFCKIPILCHGDVVLCETLAIATYVDQVFPGQRLQPESPVEKAYMLQWISHCVDYVYTAFITQVRNPTDTALVPELTADVYVPFAKPSLPYALSVIDSALAERAFLAGAEVSIADYFVFPITYYIAQSPQGQSSIDALANLSAWYKRLSESPEAKATEPSTGSG